MSLPGLFLQEARQQDSSLTQLPQDMDLWAETIVSLIREKLPSSKGSSIKISFSKKSEELGTAIGSAELFNQKLNKTIYVPLIVKSYNLCPIDVMMVGNPNNEHKFEVMPLNKEYFEDALFNGEPFLKLDKPFDRLQQLYGYNQGRLTMPPTNRNVYASANIIDSIKDSIWKQDIDTMVDTLKGNEGILVGYEKRANLDVLRTIIKREEKTASENPSLRSISLIKKDSGRNYRTISTSDEAYGPILSTQTKEQLAESLRDSGANVEDTLHEVDLNGEHMVFNGLKSKDPVVHYPGSQVYGTKEKPSEVLTFGAYQVQDKNGVYHTGLVLPNVIDFNSKQVNHKIFCSENKAALSNKILGVPTEGKVPKEMFRFVAPDIGMTGTFVITNKTNAIATIPVTICNIDTSNYNLHVLAMDLNGNKIKIKLQGGGECPTSLDEAEKAPFGETVSLKKIVKIKDFYILPKEFNFQPLDNFTELSESGKSIMQKSAMAQLDAAPIKIAHLGASQFSVKGPDMAKMASQLNWNNNNLSASETVFLLTAKQCSLKKTAQAIKIAGKFGESTIHGLDRITWEADVAAQQTKLASQWATIVRSLRVDLVKEASQFEDAQMVDAALSLNFINPDNIDKFMGFIPSFENTINMLAQTLIASRVGMTEIPEQSTSTAMIKLVDVVKGLKRLSSSAEGEK